MVLEKYKIYIVVEVYNIILPYGPFPKMFYVNIVLMTKLFKTQ